MTKKERHIVALDIGSTKTCALIGELDDDGGVKFAALGAAESKGWRKGQIVNLDLAVSSIRRAVEEAETIVGVPVESALIGVAGTPCARRKQPRRNHRRLSAARCSARRRSPSDRSCAWNSRCRKIAKCCTSCRRNFSSMRRTTSATQSGWSASDSKPTCISSPPRGTATQNIVTAVNRAGVRVDDTVLEPLASAEACLTQDERELGCCLLDIGGGTTELIAYTGGCRASYGGDSGGRGSFHE